MSRFFALARLVAPLLLALVLLAPMGAAASSFTFGGENYLKLQSGGKIDPYLAPVTGTSAGSGDLLTDYYVGLFNFNLYDAIGTNNPSVGQTYDGFDYSISDQKGVLDPNFYVTSDYFRKQGPDKTHLPDSYEMAGSLHITSVSFDNDYQITLKGYLGDLAFNDSTGSAVLQDLRGSDTVDFLLNVGRSDKTSGKFIPVLSSRNSSTWTAISGTISGGGGPVAGAPEPATLLLVAGPLAGLAAWRRRRNLRLKGLPGREA